MLTRILDRFRKRRFHRKLQISRPGFWFLLMTVALGVVALMTGNNVIYLIESFLLATLILSGIISEKAISSTRVKFHPAQGRAGERSADWIEISNRSRQTFYGIDLNEWRNGETTPLCTIPVIRPGEVLRLRSTQVFPRRGRHEWQGFTISTSGPFGFARKSMIVWRGGERIIWPERPQRGRRSENAGTRDGLRQLSGNEIAEGEIRPYQMDDDAKLIVAKLSAKGLGYFVRNRKQPLPDPLQTIDIRGKDAQEIDIEVKATAFILENASDPRVKIIHSRSRTLLQGLRKTMNAISILEPEKEDAS